MTLRLNDIVEAVDRKSTEVEVPEWGGKVLLLEPVGDAFDEAMELSVGGKAKLPPTERIRRLVQLTLCDPETREPLFVGEEGYQQLAKKSAKVVARLFTPSLGLLVADDEEVEAALGESSRDPSSDSSSD